MTKATNDAYDREHVTPWLRRSSGVRRFNVSLPDDRYAGWRWTLDYEDDLAFMQNVLAKLPAGMSFSSFDEIRSVVEANPQIAAINSHLD
jgi:spore coat polysaccharide biosynthesis protein SpsF (cytidylyltransferase family)